MNPDLNCMALSIRQPWAWLILNAGKNVENRTWRTHYRGRLLIHAAAGCSRQEYQHARDFLLERGMLATVKLPEFGKFQLGGIVGECELVGCVLASDSPWYIGGTGWLLRNVKPLPFTPCRGSLGLFRPKLEAVA